MSAEWDDFLASFDQPPLIGLRGNLLKHVDRGRLISQVRHMGLVPGQSVPWSSAGVSLSTEHTVCCAPGRHPYYHAGLFYIQEPSAMLPAEVLAVQPGERVLDLCAAPGGKSTRLAEAMQGQGLLFCNEIRPSRSRALIRNLEKHGVVNAVVLVEEPARLADRLPAYFDRILVDAPCSGEGMFRRDRRSLSEWERYGPAHYARIQDQILDAAHRLLRPGGILVYSTCTFSHMENEGTVARFLQRMPGYEIKQIVYDTGVSPGISWPEEGGLSSVLATRVARIWPHRSLGEGHFCAKLQKDKEQVENPDQASRTRQSVAHTPQNATFLSDLAHRDALLTPAAVARISTAGSWLCFSRPPTEKSKYANMYWHWLPSPPPDLAGMRIAKSGLFLGQSKGNSKGARFEPSHSFLLSLRREDVVAAIDLSLDDDRVLRYIRGETLAPGKDELPSGRFAVFLDGHPLGWARYQQGGQIKNDYPQAWRRLR